MAIIRQRYPRRYCLGLIEAGACPMICARRSSYPRRYCLGLIEARASPSGHPPASSYPRRYCLGLIEASLDGDNVVDLLTGYPRRYCLGLIEANAWRCYLALTVIGIRGVIASASLKHDVVKPGRLCVSAYPRRYCLGLIEAQVTSERCLS